MARKQRRRPEAGMYEDEHYRADVVPSPGDPIIEIYSKPHHKLLFKVSREGLKLWCKRCRIEHLMSWKDYSLWIQRPYATLPLCPLDAVEFAYTLRSVTHKEFELIAKIKPLVCHDQT